MDDEGYRNWLTGRGVAQNSAATRTQMLKVVERNLTALGVGAANLDDAFSQDGLSAAISALKRVKTDAAAGGAQFRALMPNSENPHKRLSNCVSWLRQYAAFRNGAAPTGESIADRIRAHVIETYITPARERGDDVVVVKVRDVKDALGLEQGSRNICQVLLGKKLHEEADLIAPIQQGADDSPATTFTFDLNAGPFTLEAVEEVLRARLGEPTKHVKKILAFQLGDAREVALDRERDAAQLWVEASTPLPAGLEHQLYPARRNRHHGLPGRLNHAAGDPQPVALVRVRSWSELDRLLDWYGASKSARDQAKPASSDPAQDTRSMPPSPKPTNLILYGPPGTGKTFATAAEAVRLCNPAINLNDREAVVAEYERLVEANQVEFITFHQSFGYEEFVECLRPEPIEGQAGFQLKPEMGVFRRLAQRAEMGKATTGATQPLFDPNRVFKMSLGEAANADDAYVFEDAIAEDCILLGFGDIDWSDDRFATTEAIIEAWAQKFPEEAAPTAKNARVQCPYVFRNVMREGDLVVVSKGNGSFRAIGIVAGPYEYVPREDGGYPHRRAVRWLWSDPEGVPVEEIYNKHFSMKTLYSLIPGLLNVAGINRYLSREAPKPSTTEQFVLIIDEINRANISKVFGELITLLEPDKRLRPDGGGPTVLLPYSKKRFGVPANLHVIGTMNTADRSIALLDTALRRRFEFRELMPNPKLLQTASERTGVDLVTLLTQINDRIEYLFDRDHQIGHAYFMACETLQDVHDLMRQRVIPLLAEYFYEDWSKVAAVLGDAQGEGRFILRQELKAPDSLDDEPEDPRYRWSVRSEFAADAYPMRA
ncbi:AAA family ATPase [Caulobacter sp. KR2-114]|uniref:AAA family ATPase n=1 Tax=Caulobacter sp. KR2-114 TaxID=3400912 RepID=UPI003BFDE86F